MMKPKLNHFYSIEEFCKTEFTKILGWRSHQLSVPSEVYIDSPQICIPRQARAWNTDFYDYGGILTYDELAKTPNFKGTSNYLNVILFEVWEDQGSDGHISYQHMGYIFMHTWDSPDDPIQQKKYPEDLINPAVWDSRDARKD